MATIKFYHQIRYH